MGFAVRILLLGACMLAASLCWLPGAKACPFCRADATGLAAAPAEAPGHGLPFQVSGGIDLPSAFYFRGYLQADHGPILQPYLNLFKTHALAEELVVRPYVSLFHSANFDPENRMADMSDVMVGGVVSGHAFSLDARYAFFTMNQTMRSDVHELGFKFSYDVVADSGGPPSAIAVKPFAGVYFDLYDQEGTQNTFINLGLEPSWKCEWAGFKIGLSLPAEWGLGARGYYLNADGANAPFGYFATGPAASVLLPCTGCGLWFLNASVQYLHLAADSVVQINGGDRDVCIGKIGLSFVY